MSARGFGSVLWAGAVAGAALGFYLVSLNVASERAELEQVETRIALAQRDLRLLQTEIGTRGRLAQLERWNVKFIRLSAPSADQFVDGGFKLASMVAPPAKPVIAAPVVLASAPVQQSVPQQPDLNGELAEAGTASAAGRAPSEMMHVASYSVPDSAAYQKPAATKPAATKPAPARPVAAKAGQPPAAAKPVKAAMADPLSPLPTAKSKAKGSAPAVSAAASSPKHTPRDSDH
ncbi:MAG: hypothetical protein ACJ8E4_00315 [Sphingomicrobium sp.]